MVVNTIDAIKINEDSEMPNFGCLKLNKFNCNVDFWNIFLLGCECHQNTTNEKQLKIHCSIPAPRHADFLSWKEIGNEQQISPPIFLAVSFDVVKQKKLGRVFQISPSSDCNQNHHDQKNIHAEESSDNFLRYIFQHVFCWIFLWKFTKIIGSKKTSNNDENFDCVNRWIQRFEIPLVHHQVFVLQTVPCWIRKTKYMSKYHNERLKL